MKIIYSLKEFRQRVVEITGKEPNLVHVIVGIELYGKMEFSCYADGLGAFYKGATMEEALEKLQNAITPTKPADIDVEIELPVDETVAEPIVKEEPISEPDDLPF